MRRGYDGYLRLAINHLHTTNSLIPTEQHLTNLLARATHLTNQQRIDDVFERLRSYDRWRLRSNGVTVGTRVRIELPFEPNHMLCGEVGRVDAVSIGYQGVLLGDPDSAWRDQLRYPLIQMAISRLYSVPVDETHVGVQNLDGTGLVIVSYSAAEREAAMNALNKLGRALGR